jgi:protein-L-isoaspartate(D-aspartate) O-methyltransferase
MSAQVITRVSERGFDALRLFETEVRPLRNAWQPSAFRF